MEINMDEFDRLKAQKDEILARRAAKPSAREVKLEAALRPFVRAIDEAEKMLVEKTRGNMSEYYSAVIKLAEYRLCYAHFEEARLALHTAADGEETKP
jgi:hypothetical protein